MECRAPWYIRPMPNSGEATDGNRRMADWLSEICVQLRKRSNAKVSTVAELAGVHRSAVWRWEHEAPWPADPERMVKAYAEAAGLKDSRILWEKALKAWREVGAGDYQLPQRADIQPEDFASALDDYISARRHEAADTDALARSGRRASSQDE